MKAISRMSSPLHRLPQGVRAKSATAMPSTASPSTSPDIATAVFRTAFPASLDINNSLGTEDASGDIHEEAPNPNMDEQSVYKKWAETYDADLARASHAAPACVAKELVAGLTFVRKNGPLQILDAGCGTGLIAEEMWRLLGRGGHFKIVGADTSLDMLEHAKIRGYGEVHQVDMNKPLEFPTHSFDAISCAGTLVQGQVGAEPALPELCRVVRPGGQIVATVCTPFYDYAFKASLVKLEKQGHDIQVSEFQHLRGVSALLLKITTSAIE